MSSSSEGKGQMTVMDKQFHLIEEYLIKYIDKR